MTNQNSTPAPAIIDPINEAILLLTEEADSLSDCHTRKPGDWGGEPEAKAHYDHVLSVVDALSKLRAPVADERESTHNAAIKAAAKVCADIARQYDPQNNQENALAGELYSAAAAILKLVKDDGAALASAPVAGEAQTVAWFIDWPDEPELGHYIAESAAGHGRSRPLVFADAVSQTSEPVYAYRRKGLDDFVTCDRERFDELSAKPRLFETRIFYSAPQASTVAGEPLAAMIEELSELASDMAYEANAEMDQEKASRAAVIERGEHALRRLIGAPQASEAVRDAIKTCGSKVIKALSAIALADGLDTRKKDDPELIYRDPVMDEVVRIRQAYDELNAALSAQPSGIPESCPRNLARRRTEAAMQSDRELLELAAKAAGYQEFQYCETSGGLQEIYVHDADIGFWAPLTDDGDALRLAVARWIEIRVFNGKAHAGKQDVFWCTEDCGLDPYAATRRAIVRAAAEIGALPHPDNKDGGANG